MRKLVMSLRKYIPTLHLVITDGQYNKFKFNTCIRSLLDEIQLRHEARRARLPNVYCQVATLGVSVGTMETPIESFASGRCPPVTKIECLSMSISLKILFSPPNAPNSATKMLFHNLDRMTATPLPAISSALATL